MRRLFKVASARGTIYPLDKPNTQFGVDKWLSGSVSSLTLYVASVDQRRFGSRIEFHGI